MTKMQTIPKEPRVREVEGSGLKSGLPESKSEELEAPAPENFTLAEAFDYFNGDADDTELNNERAVRAVALLLHYLSEYGNKDVDGFAAHGIGVALEKCAANIAVAAKGRKRDFDQLRELAGVAGSRKGARHD